MQEQLVPRLLLVYHCHCVRIVMSVQSSTDAQYSDSIDIDTDGVEGGLSSMEWLDLDVDLYVASDGNTLSNDHFFLELSGEITSEEANSEEGHDKGDCSKVPEQISVDEVEETAFEQQGDVIKGMVRSSKRQCESSDQHGKIKRSKLNLIAASERVYSFPAKMVNCLNVGNMKQLAELVNEYCVPDVAVKTKLMGDGVKGRPALINFLSTIYYSCPDMVMRISAIKLNRDFSIIFKGDFEGTYLDGRRDSDTSHKMIVDMREAKQIVAEAKENTNEKLTEEEKSQLESVEKAVLADPNTMLRTKASYACRIEFLSATTGAVADAPAHQLITMLNFDWKTTLLAKTEVGSEEA